MAHLEKFKATQVASVSRHDGRVQGDGTTHSNENIDDARTNLNYNLASSEQSLAASEFLKKRLSECKVLKRADVNVMCSWAVTLPKDFEGDERKFFEQSYKFLCERYGKENVVSAWVHKDEVQPHLHFKFVPVTKGKDGNKVSAKEVVNRKDLQTFHQDLQSHLEKALQCPCNVLNGATGNGNKTIQQLKATRLQAQNKELQAQNKELQAKNKALQAKCKEVQSNLASSEQSLAASEQSLATTNKKIDVAANQLKEVLDKKSRASEIHRSLFDREIQSYHVNMLESTRAIGTEAYNSVIKANKAMQKAVDLEAKVRALQAQIEPLYRQAQQERDRAKQLCEKEEQLIYQKAQFLSEEALKGVTCSERDRMRSYLGSLQFPDGSTALEHFDKKEKELVKTVKKGFKKRFEK